MQTLETKQYLTSTLGSIQNSVISSSESELNRKVTRALEKCTSCIYSISNEPTLACYCIEEHLIKTGIQLTDKRDEMRKLEKQLSGAIFDIEFSIESVKRMKNSNQNFKNTQDLIKDAIFCKQQIDYNNLSKRKFQQQMEKDRNEMSRDHSVDDFRSLASSSASTSKRNAFQRFSTSFEASIEGIASSASVDFKEFINKAANISNQFTITSKQSTNDKPSSSQTIVQNVKKNQTEQKEPSSNILNEIIREEGNE